MAVISNEKRFVNGREFNVQIKVLADGKFRIKYPEEVSRLLDATEAVGKTKSEAESIFWKIVGEYREAHQETTRIIIYSIGHSAERTARGRRQFSRDGVYLGIEACVWDMTVLDTPAGAKVYSYKRVEGGEQLPCGLSSSARNPFNFKPGRYVEYTPERYAFFNRLYEAMEGLIDRVAELKAPEALTIAVDRGLLLLGAPDN